ncbi:prepilin peptidase [Brevibacillus sp. NPDC058079]|uniref:prepilin peptidase n=1 Tax=Brevibacillus sp. NPDC058079 TaxID=3346330 RepID=UPI0036EDAC7D
MYIANYLEQVQQSLAHLYQNPLVAIVFTIFLVVASVVDVKSRKIPNVFNTIFLLARFALIPWLSFSMFDIVGAIVAFIALLIPAMVKMQKMGGDIKMAGVIGLYTGVYLIPVFIVLACIYFALYVGASKRMLPFAPFFLASNLTLMAIYYAFL